MRFALASVLLVTSCVLAFAESPGLVADRLIVYKRERKLVLLSKGKELRSYRVALGGEPVGPKARRGDHRTPEGTYRLDFQNSHSQYYKAFHISYPNATDTGR